MRRFGDRSVTLDLAGFVPMTGAGLLVVSQLNLFPLLFAVAMQRGFHAPARRAHACALASSSSGRRPAPRWPSRRGPA